ncbi:tetratricopeptide repeat protein [Actinoplanes sp. NPDC020271]|uniref:tetratricopeptide repeat protein n=1 Tax=Actinoplanes sp. NPDC020271 TaxID=3363896 RepID=UPI003799270A
MTTSAYRHAQALLEIERFAQAETTLRTALATDPGDAGLLTLLAYALRRQSSFAEARSVIEAALQAAPEDAEVHAEHAALLMALPRSGAAVAAAERAVRLDQRHLPILARALSLDDRHAEARNVAARHLAQAPHSAEALVTVADVARQAGDHDEAVRAVQAALAIDPGHRHGRWLLAMLDSERLRVRRSMRLLRDVARDDPTDPDVVAMVWPIRRLLRDLRRWSLLVAPLVCALAYLLGGPAPRLIAATSVLVTAGFAGRLLLPAGRTPWRSLRLTAPALQRAVHAGWLTAALVPAFLCAYAVTSAPWLTIGPVALVPVQWSLALAELHGEVADDPRYHQLLIDFRHDLRKWSAEMREWWEETKREVKQAWREG